MSTESTTTRRDFLFDAAASVACRRRPCERRPRRPAAGGDEWAADAHAGADGRARLHPLPRRLAYRLGEGPGEAIRIMHAASMKASPSSTTAGITTMAAPRRSWAARWGRPARQVFLMTKNCERDHAGSMKCLDDSLRRLRTDRIDLWQFHEIIYDNDPDWVFEKGGLKAAIEARKAGKVRSSDSRATRIPAFTWRCSAKPFAWDTCQFPVNVLDLHYRSFQKQVPARLPREQGWRRRHEGFRWRRRDAGQARADME